MAKKALKARKRSRYDVPRRPQQALAPTEEESGDRREFPPLPLKGWFKACGVRARHVAEAINIQESHLSNIGKGIRPYLRGHLEDIAAFLSERTGRPITPAMLLTPPGDPDLVALASEVDPAMKDAAALALTAFRRREST